MILFFEWLISISPQPTDVIVDDLIIKKFDIKRDPGLFMKWRNEIMVFTRQKHIIIFEKANNFLLDNVVKVFETDKITYKKKVEKKNPYLFEIIANIKGKIMNFKGSFLFDGLNEQNVNEVSSLVPNEKVNK